MNLYFTYSPLTANTVARAADVNTRFSGIEAGFDLLPPPVYIYEDRITYSADTGVANAYIATPSIPITAYNEGLRIRLKAAHANTGASTINVSGVGVKSILRSDGTALQVGDILAGQILDLTYDGTNFRLSLAFADISPAGIMTKIAAGGNMIVNGSVTATSFKNNGQTLDGLTAFGVSIAEAASASAARTLLGLGDVVTHNYSEFLTTAALAPYALLDNPVFSGTPDAPTPVDATNNTQLATTAFVWTRVATALAGYAPLASPTFTGTVTAGTVTAGPITSSGAIVANQNFVARGSLAGEGGQLVLGWVGSTTIGGQANSTWNIDVDASNNLRVFSQDAAGSTHFAFSVDPSTGLVTFNSQAPVGVTPTAGDNSTKLATTAFVQAAVGGGGGAYAPLDSPAFTGNPTAPTQLASNNSTRLATTAFVQTATNGLAPLASPTFTGTPSAPTPATANSSTTLATTAYVQNNLASYALLASPALTGSPTAPTQTAGNNTTRIATTAFVQGELAGVADAFMPVVGFTTARTIADTDVNSLLRFTGTTTRTITLNATPTAGFSCILVNRGTVSLTLSAASGAYLNGAGGTATSITLATSGKVTLVHEGSGIWTVDGTGAS